MAELAALTKVGIQHKHLNHLGPRSGPTQSRIDGLFVQWHCSRSKIDTACHCKILQVLPATSIQDYARLYTRFTCLKAHDVHSHFKLGAGGCLWQTVAWENSGSTITIGNRESCRKVQNIDQPHLFHFKCNSQYQCV